MPMLVVLLFDISGVYQLGGSGGKLAYDLRNMS